MDQGILAWNSLQNLKLLEFESSGVDSPRVSNSYLHVGTVLVPGKSTCQTIRGLRMSSLAALCPSQAENKPLEISQVRSFSTSRTIGSMIWHASPISSGTTVAVWSVSSRGNRRT